MLTAGGLAQLVERTNGNPFWSLEIGRALTRNGPGTGFVTPDALITLVGQRLALAARRDTAPGLQHSDQVRAERRDLLVEFRRCAVAQCDQQNHRGYTDHDPKHGQKRAQPISAQTSNRNPNRFPQGHASTPRGCISESSTPVMMGSAVPSGVPMFRPASSRAGHILRTTPSSIITRHHSSLP